MWQSIKNIYHLGNAFLANVWFGFPSKSLIVIGVTGTDGKTTTVSLIYHILHSAGYNASMISSVGAVISGKNFDVGFHVTTPSPWALQRFISLCHRVILNSFQDLSFNEILKQVQNDKNQVRHDNKVSYLVLEVTSHAIDQNRVWGIPFGVGVLTNITHEHLDYHKTYENYVKTKSKLLRNARVAVVNRDDESYELVKSKVKSQKSKVPIRQAQGRQLKSQKLITYGMNENSVINPKSFPFKTSLIGEFNRYNVLAAVAVCKELGLDDEAIRNAVSSFKPPPGREEIVHQKDFTVMVDFAHTPNAFEEILSSVKPSIKGRLIHVFGSAGERDASKRPLMGEISARYSDIIVLTAEDPRTESVEKIMEEIALGIQNSKFKIQNYNSKFKIKDDKNIIFKIPDRREAIRAGIKMAKKGDFVLITGKAHEKSMNYGKGEEPWDEFEVVKNTFRNLSGRSPRRWPNGLLRGGAEAAGRARLLDRRG